MYWGSRHAVHDTVPLLSCHNQVGRNSFPAWFPCYSAHWPHHQSTAPLCIELSVASFCSTVDSHPGMHTLLALPFPPTG